MKLLRQFTISISKTKKSKYDSVFQIKTAVLYQHGGQSVKKVKIANEISLQGGHVPPCKHLTGARVPP